MPVCHGDRRKHYRKRSVIPGDNTTPPSIAEKLIQTVHLQLDGQDWPLVLTHDVLIGCDRASGGTVLADGCNFSRPSARLVRALLYSALQRAGAGYSLDEVALFINPHNAGSIQDALQQAWIAAMPEPAESEEEEENEEEEEPPKPLTWLEAWAIARHDLGLSDQEWLDMTPRQLHALRERQLTQMRREEVLVGILASSIVNFSWCHPKRPVDATDFMLHPFPPEPLPPVTGEVLKAAFTSVLGQFQIIKES